VYSDYPNETDRQKLIAPIRLKNGGERRIDLTTTPSNAWSKHHGVASSGKEVQCIETLQPSNSTSVILRDSADRSRFIVTDRDAIEVFCRQFLIRQGFNVSDTRSRFDRT
jgi:hypothetical protein